MKKKKFSKFFSLLATLALLFNSFAAPILTSAQEDGDGGGNPGAIWTTKNDCGDLAQDVNHFDQGEGVFINGSGFAPGSDYSWDIKGKPGGASGDPDIVVASGVETVDDTGSFCIDDPDPAYTVASDDWGEYQVKFGDKGDNYQVDREIPEGPGSVTVCKVILDPTDNVVDGSERPGAEFSVSWDGSDAPIGPSSFTTPLSLNTSLFSDNADGECITYGQLPIGNYYYGEEVYPGAGWETPLYNDFFDPQATGLGDFTPYFDMEDPNRNMNSDGHIVLTDGRPNRTLAVLNQYQRIPDPTRIIVYKETIPQDDGQTPFGVTLFDAAGAAIGDEQTLTTSSSVEFVVQPGTYWVNETNLPAGWQEMANNCQGLEVEPEETEECLITNIELGSIQGRKYYDVNGNGDFDQDEKGAPGDPNRLNDWTINLFTSLEDNGPIASLLTGHTGNKGQYRFENLLPGTYYVCEVLQNGWTQTEPGQGCYEVQVEPGQAVGGIQFGNYRLGSIYGYKWEDGDGNPTTIADQDPVPNWVMELWERISGEWQDTTQRVMTNGSGYYSFIELLIGTYGIKEQMKPGWVPLSPIQRGPIEVDTSGDLVGPINFVNFELGYISGHKWHDLNGNGIWEKRVEPPIGRWRIYVEYPDGSVHSDLTNANGYYYFGRLGPGTYRVYEVMSEHPGWVQTAPVGGEFNIPMTSNAVELNNPNYDFGNYEKGSITVIKNLDSDGDGEMDIFRTDRFAWTINGRGEFRTGDTHPLPAGSYLIEENQVPGYHETGFSCFEKRVVDHSVSIAPGEDVVCIFENTRDTGDIFGWKWSDDDGDGGPDQGERGLEGWTINLYKGEELISSTTTDSAGNYSFEGVPTGDYQVCEVNQEGWDQTHPYPESCHNVSLEEDGEEYDGVDFGNWKRILDISIDKSNDKSGGAYAGDTITYTLVVTNNGNRKLVNVEVFDAFPGGFDYVEDSTLIDGVLSADPVESNGKLTWNIGVLAAGGSVTIEYQVEIPSDTVDGVYTNLASCKARYGGLVLNTHDENNFFGPMIAFVSNDNGGEWIECNIADSSVPIGSVLDISAGVEPQVLGIKTELPAAGNDTELMMGIMLAGALGFVFKLVSKKLYEEDN